MARTLSHRVQSLCQSEEQGKMFSNVCVYLGNQTLAVQFIHVKTVLSKHILVLNNTIYIKLFTFNM